MVTMAAMAVPLAAVVAERQRAEAALGRVAAIVRSSDDAILSKTIDGVITHWNTGAERLYGYAAEEAIGQPVSLIMPPELPDELSKVLAQIRQGQRVDHYETVRMRKDGRRIEVSVTVSPVQDRAGRIVGASSIARDITEQRELEAARREQDTLRSVASLAAGVAHEINNALSILLGQFELLARDVPASGRRRIDESLAATRQIHEIVGRLRTCAADRPRRPEVPPRRDARHPEVECPGRGGRRGGRRTQGGSDLALKGTLALQVSSSACTATGSSSQAVRRPCACGRKPSNGRPSMRGIGGYGAWGCKASSSAAWSASRPNGLRSSRTWLARARVRTIGSSTPVIKITGRVGARPRMASTTSQPDMPGRVRSVSTRSTAPRQSIADRLGHPPRGRSRSQSSQGAPARHHGQPDRPQ